MSGSETWCKHSTIMLRFRSSCLVLSPTVSFQLLHQALTALRLDRAKGGREVSLAVEQACTGRAIQAEEACADEDATDTVETESYESSTQYVRLCETRQVTWSSRSSGLAKHIVDMEDYNKDWGLYMREMLEDASDSNSDVNANGSCDEMRQAPTLVCEDDDSKPCSHSTRTPSSLRSCSLTTWRNA